MPDGDGAQQAIAVAHHNVVPGPAVIGQGIRRLPNPLKVHGRRGSSASGDRLHLLAKRALVAPEGNVPVGRLIAADWIVTNGRRQSVREGTSGKRTRDPIANELLDGSCQAKVDHAPV